MQASVHIFTPVLPFLCLAVTKNTQDVSRQYIAWPVLPTLTLTLKTKKSPRQTAIFNKLFVFIFASYLMKITGLRRIGLNIFAAQLVSPVFRR